MHSIPHAWITLDGKHAIDPTMPNAPQLAYFGIEFPAKLVAQVIIRNEDLDLLADPEIVAVLETAADAAEAQSALRILDLDASDNKGSALERAGFRKVGIEGPVTHGPSVRIEENRRASVLSEEDQAGPLFSEQSVSGYL